MNSDQHISLYLRKLCYNAQKVLLVLRIETIRQKYLRMKIKSFYYSYLEMFDVPYDARVVQNTKHPRLLDRCLYVFWRQAQERNSLDDHLN